MAINDELIRWCENNEYGERVGEFAREDPPSEVKSSGLKDNQPLTRQWYNHQLYNTWQLIKDLQEQITSLTITGDNSSLLQSLFSVGDVWITQSEDNPKDRFGFGIWKKQEGRYVVASDTSIPEFAKAGLKGGSDTHTHSNDISVTAHTLTEDQVPTYAHSHSFRDRYHAEASGNTGGATYKLNMPSGYNGGIGSDGTDSDNNQWLYYTTNTEDSTFGGGGSHTHGTSGGVQSTKVLPPFETYHVWQRIS